MKIAKLPAKKTHKKPSAKIEAVRARPSAAALRTLKRFAQENRIPKRWIQDKTNPTVSD